MPVHNPLIDTLNFILFAAALVTIPLTIVALPFTLISLFKSLRTLSWPGTQGRVGRKTRLSELPLTLSRTARGAAAEIVTLASRGARSLASGTYQKRTYIEYTYDVNGVEFRSQRISYDPYVNERKFLDKLMHRENINVHYNPRKPEDAVLLRGLKGVNLIRLLAVILLPIFQIAVLVPWLA